MPLSQDSVTVSAFAISPEKAGSPFSYHIIELLNQESEIVLKTPKFPTTKTLNFHCTKGNSCMLPAAKYGRKHLFSTQIQSTAEE